MSEGGRDREGCFTLNTIFLLSEKSEMLLLRDRLTQAAQTSIIGWLALRIEFHWFRVRITK